MNTAQGEGVGGIVLNKYLRLSFSADTHFHYFLADSRANPGPWEQGWG